MYDVMDISRYVVNYCIDLGKPISNLKLQKILYYIQAIFLVDEGSLCYQEEIINWRHGPIVKESYNEFMQYIGDVIYEKQLYYKDFELDENLDVKIIEKKFENSVINKNHRKLINEVVEGLIDIEDWELVAKTKEEEPYLMTERGEIIKTKLIYNYFTRTYMNKSRIYGIYY